MRATAKLFFEVSCFLVLTCGFSIGQSAPSISRLSPSVGPVSPVGGPVGIIGTNFGTAQGSSTVTFGGIPVTPTSWTTTRIVVPVPGSLPVEFADVIVTVNGQSSNTQSFLVIPVITSASPSQAAVGMPITLTGTSFGQQQGNSTVTFNGTAATPTSWTNTSITVPVPNGASNGPVAATINGFASNGAWFYVQPSISGFLPGTASIGAQVTITGSGFGTSQGFGGVTFNNGLNAVVQSWSDTSIVVKVPQGAVTGNVVVTNSSLISSSGINFTVGGPPATVSLAITPSSAAVPAGITQKFGVVANLSDGTTQDVTSTAAWSSTSPQFATVNTIGLANGIAAGTTSIQATLNGVSSSAKLTVQPPVLVNISVQPSLGGTTVGGTQQYTATGTYTDGSSQDITAAATWSSSSTTIATVAAGGLSKGVKVGQTAITARLGGAASSAGLTVAAPGALPAITVSASPAPNGNGWNHTAVTVTFVCNAGSSTIVTCPNPQLVSTEGANQVITGTVTDATGNSATASMTLNIDQSAPALTVASPSEGDTVSSNTITVTGNVLDSLSGVANVSCNGTATSVTSGNFSCDLSLNPSVNLVRIVATDVAGNVAVSNLHVRSAVALPVPASLQISPSGANMLVAGNQAFSVVDETGKLRPDAVWSTSDSTIAKLGVDELDGMTSVTGVAAGTATLTATVQGVSSQIKVNVFAGTALPAGTVSWSVTPDSGNVVLGMVQAVPSANSPDFFSLEFGRGGAVVRALTGDGQQLWTAPVGNPRIPSFLKAIPDNHGGIIIDDRSGESIINLDGQTGAQLWQYKPKSTDTGREIAVGLDGKIYFREAQFDPNLRISDWSLVGLDGDTGSPVANYTVPNSTLTEMNLCSGGSSTGPNIFSTSSISNPAVASDGTIFASTLVFNEVRGGGCSGGDPTLNPGGTMSLVTMQADGSSNPASFQTFSSPLADGTSPSLSLFDVIPDGEGGAFASWGMTNFRNRKTETHIGGVSANGTRDIIVPFDILNDVSMALGEQGALFVTNGIQIAALDQQGGNRWLWNSSPDAQNAVEIIAATAGGGLVASDGSGRVVRFDAGGSPTLDTWDLNADGTAINFQNFGYWTLGHWYGVTSGLIQKVFGQSFDLALSEYPFTQGSRQGNRHAQLPTLTAFLPSHLECPKVNLDPEPCPFVVPAYTTDTFQSQMEKKVPNASHRFEIGQEATLRKFHETLTTPLDALAYIGHAPQVDDHTPQVRAIGLSFFYPLLSPISQDLPFEPHWHSNRLILLEKDPATLVNVDLDKWRYSNDLHAEVVDKLQTDATVMFFAGCGLRPSFWKTGEQAPFVQMWDLSGTTGNKGPKVMIVSNSAEVHLALAAKVWVEISKRLAAGEAVADAVDEVNNDTKVFTDQDGVVQSERWETIGDACVRIAKPQKGLPPSTKCP